MADLEKDTVVRDETTPQTLEGLSKTKTIDTVHNDEALRVLAQYAGNTSWTPEEEKKLVRRLDRKLISLLVITYGLQYYDKAMLSQAALFGLRDDLKLTGGNRYSFSSSIFYLGFIVGSYPAILMSQRWPIERVAAGIVAVWGVCLMCSAACTSWQGDDATLVLQTFLLTFCRILRSAVLPRISRIRNFSNVHADCRRLVQKARASSSDGCLVFRHRICVHDLPSDQLWPRAYQRWQSQLVAVHVSCGRIHHCAVGTGHSVLHATRSYTRERVQRPGTVYCRRAHEGKQLGCPKQAF